MLFANLKSGESSSQRQVSETDGKSEEWLGCSIEEIPEKTVLHEGYIWPRRPKGRFLANTIS